MDLKDKLSGIVLAGGRATRMGGQDKGLLPLLGRPMISHVLEQLRPQVDDIVISANRNTDAYAQFGYPVVADLSPDFSGPLAGVRAALPHCRHDWALVVACDSPFLPPDFAETLYRALKPTSLIAIAHDGERLQPLFMLIHRSLMAELEVALTLRHFKVETWCREQPHVIVPIQASETFLNINTAEDLSQLETRLRARKP